MLLNVFLFPVWMALQMVMKQILIVEVMIVRHVPRFFQCAKRTTIVMLIWFVKTINVFLFHPNYENWPCSLHHAPTGSKTTMKPTWIVVGKRAFLAPNVVLSAW